MTVHRSRLEWMQERKADIVGPAKYVYPLRDAEQVILMTGCPDNGWMETRLTIGPDAFLITFSDVYSPFLNFITWIEKLILGEPADAVWADDEDQDHFFHAAATDQPGVLILEYVRGHYSGDGVYRRAYVSRDQLVQEFYLVLNSMMAIAYDNEPDENDEYRRYSGNLPIFVSFDYGDVGNEVIRFDLSKIEEYLANKGLLPAMGGGRA